MGVYLNPGGSLFRMARNSQIYIDKSKLIGALNRWIETENRFVCVSRPRRFGKSMAANMVAAYYDRTVDYKTAFQGLAIEEDESFHRFAARYDVLHLNMQEFLSKTTTVGEMIAHLKSRLLHELIATYHDIAYYDRTDLSGCMNEIVAVTQSPFIIIIDEWDCVFREYQTRTEEQRDYLDFLREWLKDRSYIALVYMTGILPIKKYGTHSALNMFDQYAMDNPGVLAEYTGFTTAEVQTLCDQYRMDFDEAKSWYDGYHFKQTGAIYSPRSVVSAMQNKIYDTYWNKTESFEALKGYIELNHDGLRDAIVSLMAGDRYTINISTFSNDMTSLNSADDVLTLMIHLGYLAYDFEKKEVYVPNREVQAEFINATSSGGWDVITRAIQASEKLLSDTLACNADAVAGAVERAHMETSHLQYNDENALAYTIALAYYSARQYYNVFRELPTGNGIADIVFIPRPAYPEKPALIVELKWNRSAKGAIAQIKDKRYIEALSSYSGKLLLVGINYDKKSRKHSCAIHAEGI